MLKRAAERCGRRMLASELARMKADLKATERTMLAVELHDSLAQNLTGISIALQTAQRCEEDRPTMMRHIAVAGSALRSCIRSLKDTLWDLRSRALEEPDVARANGKYWNSFHAATPTPKWPPA